MGHRRAIGFARGERVEGRAHSHDAGRQRDLVADQARRVAVPVNVLVVVEDRVGDGAVAVESADERGALLWMAPDHGPVIVGQDLGAQDTVREGELAYVGNWSIRLR